MTWMLNREYAIRSFNHLEKYESQLGRIIPYIMDNIFFIQTTNQIYIYYNVGPPVMLVGLDSPH